MRTIRVRGASDDIVEVEGTRPRDGEPDEFGVYDRPGVICLSAGGRDALHVVVEFGPGNVSGCWMIGLLQPDKGAPLPAWPMRWSTHEGGRSVELEIDVPDNVTVRRVYPPTE